MSIATLAAQPSSNLLRIISELLKHAPELVPIVQECSDNPALSPADIREIRRNSDEHPWN